jgi:hypothetical protein
MKNYYKRVNFYYYFILIIVGLAIVLPFAIGLISLLIILIQIKNKKNIKTHEILQKIINKIRNNCKKLKSQFTRTKTTTTENCI